MSEHFRTPEDYELFLYTLTERFPSVRRSTIRLVRRGSTLARVAGEIAFDQGIRLTVRERITFERLPTPSWRRCGSRCLALTRWSGGSAAKTQCRGRPSVPEASARSSPHSTRYELSATDRDGSRASVGTRRMGPSKRSQSANAPSAIGSSSVISIR